jgi:hypothetical protein
LTGEEEKEEARSVIKRAVEEQPATENEDYILESEDTSKSAAIADQSEDEAAKEETPDDAEQPVNTDQQDEQPAAAESVQVKEVQHSSNELDLTQCRIDHLEMPELEDDEEEGGVDLPSVNELVKTYGSFGV